MNYAQLIEELLAALQQNKRCAMVTIVETQGSVSRSEGKMLVYEDGAVSGTIGGGAIERAAIMDAHGCILAGKSGCFHYDLKNENAAQGLACFGSMQVFTEVFHTRPSLYLCGGGHIGRALIPLAQAAGYLVTLIDTRTQEDIPDAAQAADAFVRVEAFEEGLHTMQTAPDAVFVITTYGHAQDGEALYAALQKEAAYIGMVGSVKKREALFSILRTRGVAQEALEQVYTPAGLDLGGQTPAEIAIAIIAEIMQVVHKRTGKHTSALLHKA